MILFINECVLVFLNSLVALSSCFIIKKGSRTELKWQELCYCWRRFTQMLQTLYDQSKKVCVRLNKDERNLSSLKNSCAGLWFMYTLLYITPSHSAILQFKDFKIFSFLQPHGKISASFSICNYFLHGFCLECVYLLLQRSLHFSFPV